MKPLLFCSTLLIFASGLVHAQVSITTTPIPNGVQITGTCTPGGGKVQVNLIPVPGLVTPQVGKISTKQVLGGPTASTAGTGCQNGGVNGVINMTNSTYASGSWVAKIKQGSHQATTPVFPIP